MSRKAIVTVGLGFGDESKGATVDWLCRHFKADLVVRYSGGSQCGHNVELPTGARHCFSQFGAGSFADVPTYLGPEVIIYPEAMWREYLHLFGLGYKPRLFVHPKCLVTTFFHRSVNRYKEERRGQAKHGSCGHGIGETRSYALNDPIGSMRAEDLCHLQVVEEKTEAIAKSLKMPAFGNEALHVWDAWRALTMKKVVVVTEEPPAFDTAVFEGAQGVLLDEDWGFHPYTTWSKVTTDHAFSLLKLWNVPHHMTLGVIRSYHTRHGAGPFPTYDEKLTQRLPDPGNPHNPWQEHLRCGWLDFSLLRYALTVQPVDAIALSHIDQLPEKFGDYADIAVRRPADLASQELLGNQLKATVPIVRPLPGLNEIPLMAALEHAALAPVVIGGYGPTHKDRGGFGWIRQFQFGPRTSSIS